MENVNLVGQFFDTSGFANHMKYLSNALVSQCPSVRIDTMKPQGWELMVNDAELNMLTKPFDSDCCTISISSPPMWRYSLVQKPAKFAGYTIWEGDRVPVSWIPHMLDSRVDYILVPSHHVRDAIVKTVKAYTYESEKENTKSIICTTRATITNKIHIVPHGVDTNIFKPTLPCKCKDKFVFVCNKGWRGTDWDRGGVQYLLKAFSQEFGKSKKVELVLKLNPSYAPVDVPESIKKLGIPTHGNIKINAQNLSNQALCEFYRQGDVYVCPTRAEAFNLTGLEAMGCGLPTIQTGYGGQMEYMTRRNSWFTRYSLRPVKEDVMYEGVKWATPSIPHLRKQLRYAYENRDIVKRKGDQALKDAQKFTWTNTAKKINEIIK